MSLYCHICGEYREERYTCRKGGKSIAPSPYPRNPSAHMPPDESGEADKAEGTEADNPTDPAALSAPEEQEQRND